MKTGRPSKFTHELFEEICERLSEGETLTDICADAHMPHRNKVYEWMEKNAIAHEADRTCESLSGRFAIARAKGFDAIAEKAFKGANDGRGDSMVKVARDRLKLDAALKLLAKWCPKRYAEKIEVEHSGTVRAVIGGADA